MGEGPEVLDITQSFNSKGPPRSPHVNDSFHMVALETLEKGCPRPQGYWQPDVTSVGGQAPWEEST